jgi:tagatose-1,6-bisphosphate aldolase
MISGPSAILLDYKMSSDATSTQITSGVTVNTGVLVGCDVTIVDTTLRGDAVIVTETQNIRFVRAAT